MDTPLPAVFASHFTAKVAATCTIFSIIIFLLFVAPNVETALLTPAAICGLHAFLALMLFVLEHRYVVRGGAPENHSAASLILLYFVNVAAATLPVVVLFYGQFVLDILAPGQ